MASGGGGGSGPAESLIPWDFCHHVFRRPTSLLAVSFSRQGCARNIFSSSHHPSSKAFYPLKEGAHGNAIHGADFLPASHSWDPVGTTITRPLGAPTLPDLVVSRKVSTDLV